MFSLKVKRPNTQPPVPLYTKSPPRNPVPWRSPSGASNRSGPPRSPNSIIKETRDLPETHSFASPRPASPTWNGYAPHARGPLPQRNMRDAVKRLNDKINKLYSWQIVELDLVSRLAGEIHALKRPASRAQSEQMHTNDNTDIRDLRVGEMLDAFRKILGNKEVSESLNAEQLMGRRKQTSELGLKIKDDVLASKKEEQKGGEAGQERPTASMSKPKRDPAKIPPEVQKWFSDLEDEIETATMTLSHLVEIIKTPGEKKSERLADFRSMVLKCEMLLPFLLTDSTAEWLPSASAGQVTSVRSRVLRLNKMKNAIRGILGSEDTKNLKLVLS